MKNVLLAAALTTAACLAADALSANVEPMYPLREDAPRLFISSAVRLPHADLLAQRHPAVAFGNDTFLIAWQDGFNGLGGKSDILALRIPDTGTNMDKTPLNICTADGIQDTPAAAFCADRFLVAWSDLRNGTDYDLYAAFVDKDGRVSPKDGILLAGGAGAQACPAIASNGKDQFLVVWQNFRDADHFAVCAARIAAKTGDVLDKNGFVVMDRGERPDVAWTGTSYAVCQRWYAALVGDDGKVKVPSAQLWNSKTGATSSIAAAWGKAFVFLITEPFPDPWGWGGNGSAVGMSLDAGGKSPERALAASFRDLQAAEADGRVPNCLDAAQWRNHPGWPMGMRGGLKGTRDDTWPSGQVAAACNGRSLLVVWPRAHLVDTRRLANRDLYLTRVLPDWGMVDRPPLKIVAGPTEEANPVLCAGPAGSALLAYETVEANGVAIEYRLITESEDRTPPRVAYVVPKSDTESILAFDEPIDADSASKADNFRIDGLAVKAAAFNPDARGLQREVIVTTDPPVRGKSYVLRVTGVKDRSPAANAMKDETVNFVAKPGVFQRGEFIERWAVVGPLPRDTKSHPLDPEKVHPSLGDSLPQGGVKWAEMKGPVVDFGDAFGEKPDLMVYASAYVFSDHARDAVLCLDTNDHNRVWLNGVLGSDGITTATGSRGFHDQTDRIRVSLQKGWNQLLVQVENRSGAWLMIGHLTGPGGVPVRDLTWQLDNPFK